MGTKEEYCFKLYIVDSSPNSVNAVRNLKKLLKKHLQENYSLKVIDVLENPQVAEDEKILATPLLVKISPPPVRRIVGDLSDEKRLLPELGILPQ